MMLCDDLNSSTLAASFEPVLIADVADAASVDRAAQQYRRMILCVLLNILDRYESGADARLIDTKLDVLSGRDFPANDPLRGKRTVYAWIQGRALEALAGHAAWIGRAEFLSTAARESLIRRIHRVLREVMGKMEEIRARNNGRLRFMMTPEGQPLEVNIAGELCAAPATTSDAPASFSDLFYAKGLAAAAAWLGDGDKLHEAQRLLARTFDDIRNGRFASDQQPMDPKNPVRAIPGRFAQGPWMITVGAATLMLATTGEAQHADMGSLCIRHIIEHHVKRPGSGPEFCRDFDMWEFADAAGHPFLEGGALRCDPGHATEFAGLGLKFLRVCRQRGFDPDQDHQLQHTLSKVLRRNFDNGFASLGKGLCKAYDLVARRAINTDMPWWSLPETIRAAIEAHAAVSLSEKRAFAEIARQCSNALMTWYIRPDRHLMANQTINEAGAPVPVVPATPDADPGYHTGLSLIDALDLLMDAK